MKRIPGIFANKKELSLATLWVVVLGVLVGSLTIRVFRSLVGL